MNNKIDFTCHQPVSKSLADFDFSRRLGFDKKIIVNNISGKDAWVVLSPSPITAISSMGTEKLGNLSFSKIGGEIKCQQFGIKNNNKKEYQLDNSQIYYTVFFNCDGKWKCPYKDRKINAKIYDINLLPKNVDESIDTDFVPKL
jgi:hypothetical protein